MHLAAPAKMITRSAGKFSAPAANQRLVSGRAVFEYARKRKRAHFGGEQERISYPYTDFSNK